MKIKVDHQTTVTDCRPQTIAEIRDQLTFDNPAYLENEKRDRYMIRLPAWLIEVIRDLAIKNKTSAGKMIEKALFIRTRLILLNSFSGLFFSSIRLNPPKSA